MMRCITVLQIILLIDIKYVNGVMPIVVDMNLQTIIKRGAKMLKKFLLTTLVLTPLVTLAKPNEHAFEHANGQASFMRAPEINGGNLILGFALLGGIVSLVSRNRKK
jgi:hypothetical protein